MLEVVPAHEGEHGDVLDDDQHQNFQPKGVNSEKYADLPVFECLKYAVEEAEKQNHERSVDDVELLGGLEIEGVVSLNLLEFLVSKIRKIR